MLDPSQLGAALQVIGKAERPLLFVYIHGWQNNAVSGDVCRFEHFIDTMSRFPEMTGRKINVIGVYIAWRGRDLTVPGLNLLTFWSRKSAGQIVASQNGCLAAISELALAARAPDKKYHHCVLLGHSFGGLVLGSTISHSILDAGSNGVRNSSPWDMAVAFNSADSSIGSRQLIAELNYLYKYDEKRHAYVARTSLESGVVIEENRPFLVILQSENDQATGAYFPIGTGVYNTLNLRFHWDKVSVPGTHHLKVSEEKFYTQTPGNNPYLVNYHVVPLGETTAPSDLKRKRTGHSKPISSKTCKIRYSTPVNGTMATKTVSAGMAPILPMKCGRLPEKKFGGGGNSCIRVMPGCPAGLSGCQRISFGGTADCGATILSPCWALFSVCISRWKADALCFLPSDLALRRPRTFNS